MDLANKRDENKRIPLAKTLKRALQNEENTTAFSTVDELLETEINNPLLISLVIQCVLEFLNIEEIKNCRLVSREWGSTGKLVLGRRAVIRFHNYKYNECKCKKCMQSFFRPGLFAHWFLDSTKLFSAFKISGILESLADSWAIEELTQFFDKQQNYIKELTLNLGYSDDKIVNIIDLSSWISKSPMVQKDAKYMTKLSIEGDGKYFDIPVQLISHIKDLTLTNCRITLEPGIKIRPVTLKLENVTFFQDGIILHRLRINDFVDLSKAKEISLHCVGRFTQSMYVLDLWGNTALDKLTLSMVEIVNGEISNWAIENLWTSYIRYSLNSLMNIKEFGFCHGGPIDLFTLPTSIQKLSLHTIRSDNVVRCSQPIGLENLQSLKVCTESDFSFLYYFRNCSQLTHLTLDIGCTIEMKSLWMPRRVKTLTLERCLLNWVDEYYAYLTLDKLIVYNRGIPAKELCESKILVEDFIVYFQNLERN